MQKQLLAFVMLMFLSACAPTKKVNEGVLRTYPDGSKIEVLHVPQEENKFQAKQAHSSPQKTLPSYKIESDGKNQKQLSSSEFNTLGMQLSRCWSTQAGTKYSNDLQVELHLTVDRARNVKTVKALVDVAKLNNPDYLSAVETAKKAVRSKKCTPLNLPPDKYDTWKNMIVTFDPREML